MYISIWQTKFLAQSFHDHEMSKNARPSHDSEENASPREKRNSTARRRQNEDDKVIRFRCDFPSTQVRVMLARGWTQVMECPVLA